MTLGNISYHKMFLNNKKKKREIHDVWNLFVSAFFFFFFFKYFCGKINKIAKKKKIKKKSFFKYLLVSP